MSKTSAGRFFEDYCVGQVIEHAVPRTVSGGERALYHALYPARHALYSSDEFARACGLNRGADRRSGGVSPGVRQDRARHLAERHRQPGLCRGPLAAAGLCRATRCASVSEVIGLKQNSNGKSGVVWVRTTGLNQWGQAVLTYVRWVMVRKRDEDAPAPETVIPQYVDALPADDLAIPEGLDFEGYDFALAGEPHRWGDYDVGETDRPCRRRHGGGGRAHAGHPPVAEHRARCISTPPRARMASG